MQNNESGSETAIVRPTKKQQELLEYISGFIQEHGYSPSYREIMNGLNYNAVATVALHVGNLIKRGHLRKRSNSARSLELVNPSFGSGSQTNIRSNQINPSEEKWLVQQLENRCVMLESAGVIQSAEVDDVFILAGALRVLGLDGAAQSFAGRLSELRKRCNEQDDAVDLGKTA
jgi:hypothetical protein